MIDEILDTYEKLVENDGRKVTCYIEDVYIDDAEIIVEDEKIYILQNIQDGFSILRKNGYRYSWFVCSLLENLFSLILLFYLLPEFLYPLIKNVHDSS